MKLNKSNISTQKFNIDDFWDDCIQKDKKENNFLFKMPTEKIKLIKKLPYNNKTYINNCYKKFCLKNPNLFQEEKNNKIKKKRQRNSIKRTLLLYSYGLEQKKLTESIYNENKIKKEQDELKLCTWKPKLYKPNQTSSNFIKKIDKPRISQTNKALEIITNRECTFKPKTNNRDEHILKRFRKLSVKDESYRNSFFELTSRDCEQNYKNYLNVNNHIDMYDIELKANYNDNKYIFDLSAGNYSNLLKSKNPSSINNNKKMKAKEYYKGILKKQLSLIDLESM